MSKVISNFINNELINNEEMINKYNKIYQETNIVTIHEFISFDVLKEIKTEIENYKWWSYAITPNNNIWNVQYKDEISSENIKECINNLENKNFTYRFKRCLGNHYNTCQCISCRLTETVSSINVTELLCKIVGCKKLSSGEIFLSNYGKDDFLSIHHDIKKGDITATFSLTYDWHPTYGGLLNFCDENNNIYKSITPNLGSVNIFKLDETNGIDHFVSTVNVNKNRYTISAWYNIIE
jgi:Rps23 Pro-64 3,4-dihydroxylase Tpa1-like proline 4-hydroxylase